METMEHPIILTIAGSDPSGGAGIQADIKTISALGGYAATAITALTVQNTLGVTQSQPVAPDILRAQLEAVLSDLTVDAVKIGMLATAENVAVVAEVLRKYPVKHVVCDPVILSTSGHELLSRQGVELAKECLFPLCTLITPNLPEAAFLGGDGAQLSSMFQTAVLVKGGHAEGDTMTDTLYEQGQIHPFSSSKIVTTNLHGTGCTLSSAIATYLALGHDLKSSVKKSKEYIFRCIEAAVDLGVGHGNGPLWHFLR